MPSIYLERGYNTRREYLESLADDYGVPLDTVLGLASVLGEKEDFDMLPSRLAGISEKEWDK